MKYRLFLMVEPLLIIIFDFIHIANWFKKKLLTKKRREFDWEVKIMSTLERLKSEYEIGIEPRNLQEMNFQHVVKNSTVFRRFR